MKQQGKLFLKKSSAQLVVFYTVLFSFLAHAYRYFNPMYSHDSLMLYQNDIDKQIGLGRYLQPAYLELRGNLCAPFLIAIFSLLWLSAAIYLIIKLFNIQSKAVMILTCGVLSTNATLTFTNATYVPWSDVFTLSLLFCVLGVYFYQKYKYGFLIGSLFIFLSLALYQSYLQSAVVLFILLLIKNIIDRQAPKEIVKGGLKALCSLFLGLILYSVVLKIVLHFSGVQAADTYNGLAGVGNFAGISIPGLLYQTYVYPFKYFLHPETYHASFIALLNIIVFLLFFVGLVKFIWQKKPAKLNIFFLILLILLLPFGANVVYFISKGMEHSLMIFSFFLLYLLPLLVLDYQLKERKENEPPLPVKQYKANTVFCSAIVILLALFVLNNVIFSNQVYLKKDLEYQATQSAMTRIIDRMEEAEGYVPKETPVAIVGTFSSSTYYQARPGFQHINGVGTAYGPYALTYDDTYRWYFENILGYPIRLLSTEEQKAISLREDIQALPAFPAKDSCKMVDGVFVIKLS